MLNARRAVIVPLLLPFTTRFFTRPPVLSPDPDDDAPTETASAVTSPPKRLTLRMRADALALPLPPAVDVFTCVPTPRSESVPVTRTYPFWTPSASSRWYAVALALAGCPPPLAASATALAHSAPAVAATARMFRGVSTVIV